MNSQNHYLNEKIVISSNQMRNMRYSKRIYLVLFFWVTSVLMMRIPIAYQQGYHSGSEIEEAIDTILSSSPDFIKKTCSQSTSYNYLQIGSPNTSRVAYIICNIHAREIITAQICLNWLQNISKQSFLKQYFLRVFYIANSNRQTFIDDESTCVRKNQNNVDTNRNFPTDFNHLNVDSSSDLYGGAKALDQPLSQCLNGLFTERKPFLFLDIHSGMDKTFFYQEGENNQNELKLINRLNRDIFNSSLRISTLAQDGQTINGHIFADLKVRLDVQYSFLFQTFMGDYTKGCFYQFNPEGQEKSNLITKVSNSISYLLQGAFSKFLSQSPKI